MYPLRYTEDFFAKFDEVAARISSTGAEDIFETGSIQISYHLSRTVRAWGKITVVRTPLFLFEDSDLFAISKPAGIHSVQLPSGGGTSVADILLQYDPRLYEASRSPLDAGLVQRLDFETSGVMLGAKRRAIWDILFDALLKGEIKKTYSAIVEGILPETIRVSSYIGSPNRGAHKMKVYTAPPPASARSLEGTTEFSLIRYDKTKDISIVHASASPARRHQIRAHAAHLGHPLLGDSLYGSTRQLGSPHPTPQRQFFLHATTLSFRHPSSGEEITITSEPFDEIDMLVG